MNKLNEGICKCNHHSKDHSYSLDAHSDNLKCDKCNCKNYQFKSFKDTKMKLFNITIREFPKNKTSERYSLTIGHSTRGWYSLRQILKFIEKDLNETSNTSDNNKF